MFGVMKLMVSKGTGHWWTHKQRTHGKEGGESKRVTVFAEYF